MLTLDKKQFFAIWMCVADDDILIVIIKNFFLLGQSFPVLITWVSPIGDSKYVREVSFEMVIVTLQLQCQSYLQTEIVMNEFSSHYYLSPLIYSWPRAGHVSWPWCRVHAARVSPKSILTLVQQNNDSLLYVSVWDTVLYTRSRR